VRRRLSSPPALAGAAVVLLAALALAGVNWLGGEESVRSDRSALRVVAHTKIASQGGSISSGFGAVWAADPGAGEVVRLATDTGRLVGRIRTDGRTRFLDTGAGAVWVFELDSGRLLRIDPAAGRVIARIPLSLPAVTQADVLGAADAVWVATRTEMLRIDPGRNAVKRRVPLNTAGFELRSAVLDGHALYLQRSDGVLLTLDARTGARQATTRPQLQGFVLNVVAGTAFAVTDDGVAAFDTRSGRAVWIRRLGAERVNGSATAGPLLWVQGRPRAGGRDRLWRLSAKTGRVTGSLVLPEFGVAGMAAIGERLWLVSPGGRLVIVAPQGM
jgi:outer membrane protein assembly factor BamB